MLKHDSSETLTTQLEKLFMQKIESGAWPTDTLIPSEISLAKEYSVSRTTIHWTLLRLQSLGLIYRVPGKGTAVTPQKPVAEIGFLGIREQLYHAQWSGNYIVLRCEFLRCPLHIASILNINESEKILYLERLYFHPKSNKPRMLQYSYLHNDYSNFIDIHKMDTTSIHAQLLENGISYHGINEWLEASGATEYEAKKLELSVGSPVLILEEHRLDRQSQPFYFTRMVTRGDSLRLSFSQTYQPDGTIEN